MFNFSISTKFLSKVSAYIVSHISLLTVSSLAAISVCFFIFYYVDGLGLAYNDARSHLDIGRRVVEGLKPGLAQIGSVWLPLPHLLMVPTVWNDFFWHSGLSGAIQSMIGFVATGVIISKFLDKLKVGAVGRLVGVAVFVANMNILYLQSTAMTELILIATMTLGCYYVLAWHQSDSILDLVKAAFWVCMSTMVRYDGWFLLLFCAFLVIVQGWRKGGYKKAEGAVILFCTLGGFGIALWLLWNLLIFKDPLYFALGPYSAHAQQELLAQAGDLFTEHNLYESVRVYFYALLYNSYTFPVLLGLIGAIALWFDKKLSLGTRFATIALLAPLLFNIVALYFGFSVLFIQGLAGETWFNVRYGIMLAPSIAIFVGYFVDRAKHVRWTLIGLLIFITTFGIINNDAVTIDDASVGSSQKNVSEVAGYLNTHTKDQKGFIMISAASHDAIIFSSGLPMKRFIHEGTGAYWESASITPDRWARWLVMRTHDENDSTFKAVSKTPGFKRYTLVTSYPFADVYEIKSEYLEGLITEPVFGKQR